MNVIVYNKGFSLSTMRLVLIKKFRNLNMKKLYLRLFAAFLCILVFPKAGFSSHIVGGALTYTYNGGNNYTVMLKLYRDCSGVAFPATAPISVLQANGSLFAPSLNFTLPGGAITNVAPILPPCATSPSVVPCVEERVYTATVTLPASPGGMHLVYSVCCRNPAISNIVNPGGTGETFYAFIPCFKKLWVEDFTLPNGTTSDSGPTAWTNTVSGVAPLPTAQVNTGQFEVISQNSGSASNIVWASQAINISSFASGVNLSVNYSDPVGNTLENSDSIKVFYSLNGGPKVLFPINGQRFNDFDANIFATASGLIGNTVEIFVRIAYGALSPNDEIYRFDMVSVYNNVFLSNSSPAFNNLPPLLFCSANTFSLNHSASDIDGDSLSYTMYTPYNDAPAPTYPNNVFSVTPITWVAGYSATSPFNSGGPGVTLNANTGALTGVANTNGSFVFGVKCSEYRNGVLLSEMVRDYQVTAVTCPPFVPSAPVAGANSPLCAGQTLNLTASFTAGATYNWTGPNGFTSTLQNPSIVGVTVLATGVYSVTATISGCTGPAGTVAVTVNTIPSAPIATANSPVCAGQTLSLSASFTTGATYNWIGPNGFTSALQNPTIGNITLAGSGTYSVSGTISGCTGPVGTVAVTVNPIPATPTAGANSPLCAGQTLNLTASTISGATYSWTGPNSFTSTTQNPSISGIPIAGSGTYSVSAVAGGCSGPTGTVSVTVNPAPSAPVVGGNTPLCAGQTLNLTATFTTGASYSWSGPNGFTSALQNPSISNITLAGSGVYSVNATAAGCPGPISTTTVTVNASPAAPTAGANTPLCSGQTLSLTATFTAGATYNWTGPNSFSSGTQNPTIAGATPAATGLYSVTATVAGCTGPVGTVSVNVSNQPSAPVTGANTPLCVGQTLSLTATFTTGLSYTWSGPNGFSSVLQNPSIPGITLAGNGTYSVFATTAGGCAGPSGTLAVTVNPIPSAPTAGANTPLCVGQTLNLTSTFTAGATYNWAGPNTFTSNLQNPNITAITAAGAGIYTVNATIAGCQGPAGTISVTVKPTPSAPVIGANNPLCVGQTLNLTSTFTTGSTYSWSGPNGFTSTLQNPSIPAITLAGSGIYSVNATINGCTGLNGTLSVTVNPIPLPPSAGANSPICALQTLSLTASPSGANSYAWTGPNAFTSTSQNPTILNPTVTASGTYSVTQTVLGCTGSAGTVGVVVNATPAAPVAGGSATLCAGSTVSLTASTVSGAAYSWTGPNGFSSALQNPTIAGASTLATGMYSVTATVAGCTGPAGTFSVNVFGNPPPPTLGSNGPVCTGQTLNLTAGLIAGASYLWTGPNGFSSTLQNPNITNVSLAAGGTYTVGVNVSGCGSSASTLNVVVNATPASPAPGSNSPLCAGSTINLTAVAGANSYSWTGPNSFSSSGQNPTIANASTLATGMYSVTQTISGCTGPIGTVSVTVNPIPAAPTAAANTTLCAGQNINLTASPNGAIYNWSGPNSFTSTIQNPVIVGASTLATGTYSVTQTLLGCTSSPGMVTVSVTPKPLPPVAGANSPICALQTLSLTASNGGNSYNWTGPNSFVSTNQNPTILSPTVNAAGTYSVTQTVNGCTSNAGTVSVIINPTPFAPITGGTPTLCVGSTINLTASNITGAAYSWSGPNGFSSTTQNPSITGAGTVATGMYSVNATVGGCTGPNGTFSVSVFGNPPPPNLGANTPVCTGQTLILTASSILGASYSWIGPNGFTSNLQNPTLANVTTAAAGNYSVGVNVSGCGSSATVIAVTVNTTPAAPSAGTNSALCEGSTINLNANPGGSIYNWTGPNSFTSTLQSPSITGATTLATGMYSVTQTVNGCISTAGTISITVNLIPAAPTAGSNSVICAGQTLSLTASPNGATYNWSGPNGFTSTLQNPTIPNASTLASGTYSVTQTLLGCTGSQGVVSVTVNPIPSAPVISNNSPICALQTLSFTAANGGTSYSWTGPNGFTSSAQNPTIANTSTLAAGNYSATQTILGCTSPAAITNVTINPAAPTPTATSNSPICLSQNINFTQTAITGATYSWSGPNSFTASIQNPTITSATTSASGTYSLFATVAGCPGQTITLNVLVSMPGTVTPGSSPTVCANNSTVVLNGLSSTGSGTWSSGGTGVFSPNNLTGNYMPTAAQITAGAVTLTLTSTNNGGCQPVSNTLNIQITPAPTASAGANQTVCANNATVSLNGSVTVATSGTWSASGTGTFVPNNSALTASYVPSSADITSGSFTITLTTTGNGNCFAVSNSKVITISPAPVVIPGANPQVVCKNNPNFQLNGSSTTGSGTWLSSGTGTFSPNNNILNPTYIPSTADTTNGTITLTLTSTNNGGCNLVSQTMALVYVSTLAVNPGTNQTVCSNNASVPLNGVSTTSAGVWTSSGTGSFSPSASLLTTNYVPSAADISAGVVTLTLTSANNGGCNPVMNAMTITITPGPTANAGSSQTVCANNATVALSGSVTIAGGGIWSSSGTGSFTPNNTAMNVNYVASAADTTAGSVIITLSTTSNGNCNATTNTMVVNFNSAPLVNAGSNIAVCKNNPVAVLNGYSSTGSATWTTLGTGAFSPNSSVINPTYTPSSSDTTAGSVTIIYTSINNGGCNAVKDTMTITYSGIPTVTAGLTQTVCANNSTVTLNGLSSTGSGTWSSSGTGTFSPNSINGNYIPSPSDISSGVVTLSLTSTNNGGCSAVFGQTTVNITPAPIVNAGSNQTVCANTSSIGLSGSFSIATGATWSSAGTGTFSGGTTNMNTSYAPSNADTTAGTVMIFLTSNGNGNCLQVVDTMLIDFTSSPFVSAGPNLNLCPNSPNPVLNGLSSSSTVTWTTLGSGSFSPSNTVLNPTYIPSAADNSAGTVAIVVVSGTASCGSGADTMVIAFKAKPTAAFTFSNSCIGSATSFTDVSTAPATTSIVSWLWYFNNDTTIIHQPSYTFSATGTQTIGLVVSNGNCRDSVSTKIFINAKPVSAFNHTVLCRDSVVFKQMATVSPGGIATWNWDFGDVTTSMAQNPVHVYQDTGTYFVTLVVKSDSNCTASIMDTVRVKKCANDIVPTLIGEPAVPSGFTPNGDGNNDVLFVKGGPYTSLDFRIFNEWGNQIFRSEIQTSGWDGSFKSTPQPVGKYIWTLTGEMINGKQIKMAGETILNR